MERLTKKFTDGGAYCEGIEDVGIKGINAPTYVGKAVEKLADYEDAEEQGLLIRLPCKVGDTVFLIMKRLSEKTGTVEKLIIDAQIYEIEIFDKEILFKNNKTYSFQPKDVGKKVFLTREEAEIGG